MAAGKLPALKNPPQRDAMPRNPEVTPNLKKQASKSSVSRSNTKELDANGNPMKKDRKKRAPKVIEEVEIAYRVKTLAEKHQESAEMEAAALAGDNDNDENSHGDNLSNRGDEEAAAAGNNDEEEKKAAES